MTLDDAKEIKQNEENNLKDFKLQGKQVTLQSRPDSSYQRIHNLETAFRAMSATPTLSYQEKHRKTPPWTRPQSADHLSRSTNRRKIAAKFERNGDRRNSKSKMRKGGGSMNNLLESSSMDDMLDSETSVTPSPVPSLTDVLRSGAKLEPGLAGKPPIPPTGLATKHKSLDDIINIKFQRWFPEAIQDTYAESVTELTGGSKIRSASSSSQGRLKASKSTENLCDSMRNSSSTPETQVTISYPLMQFDAYESPRIDSGKKLPRTHTMETIHESDDNSNVERPPRNPSQNRSLTTNNETDDFLKSKIGQSLNNYFSGNGTNPKKKVTIENHGINNSENNLLSTECANGGTSDQEKIFDTDNRDSGIETHSHEASRYDGASGNPEKVEIQLNGEPYRTGLNSEDILSWMGNSTEVAVQEKALGSTYEDILKMLKVLEKEEVESLKLEALSVNRSNNTSACSNITPAGTSCRDILTFLDDVDRGDSRNEIPPSDVKNVVMKRRKDREVGEKAGLPGGRMGQLLAEEPADLAQKVMGLSLDLEEKSVLLERTQMRLDETTEKLKKHKTESDSIIKRHQTFIDQLLQEKKLLGEQCASIVKEMEEKNKKMVASMESRHEVEMKKLQEKMLAAEKLRREKWENEKIKKIKEMTVKGLEPELERMSRAHQDELAELRRAHEREVADLEAACSRRISAAREQALRDREQAVSEEREAARKKLEAELAEVERSYQDQRRRLLVEVREEKERLEREAEAKLAQQSRQLEDKWAQSEAQLQGRLQAIQENHELELKKLRETVEGERQSWLNHQVMSLAEKEKQIRESVKKERDKHIEAVIRRLDQEAQEKEKALEAKLVRMKEEYERELKESEGSLHETKRKLKEARSEAQELEELVSKLRSQVTQLDCQLSSAKQQIERLEYDRSESRSLARSEACSQIAALQRELSEERLKREESVANLQAEKERDLQQVYNRLKKQEMLCSSLRNICLEMASVFERVKEAIAKKEESVRVIQKQRDAALEQCSQLENMVDHLRKELTLRK